MIRKIEIACDTSACGAYYSATARTVEQARKWASGRGWTHRDGRDTCRPCGRGNPPQARGETP